MKEHTFDRSVEAGAPMAQPHFDDERTVLLARPVVPLEKVDAKLKHRRQWFLGGAFAIAMVLGAASALLASYLKLRNASNPGSEISQLEVASAPSVSPETVASDEPVVESIEEPAVVSVTPKKESTVKRRTTVKSSPQIIEPRITPKMNEEDDLHRIRETVLYDEWQERRARRTARRERRRLDRYNHRDLSNLDEIFEGPRRRRP